MCDMTQGTHFADFTQELGLLQNGVYRQSEIFNVDLGVQITDKEITSPKGNCLVILPRIFLNGAVQLTDVGANSRCFIRFNNPDAPAIPFSLIPASGDFSAFVGTYYRMFVTVPTVVAGKVLYFASFIGGGLASAVGGTNASGYAPPGGGTGTKSNTDGVVSGGKAGYLNYGP